jgi:hypothetical protein
MFQGDTPISEAFRDKQCHTQNEIVIFRIEQKEKFGFIGKMNR